MREVLPNTTKPYIDVQHLVTNIGLTYFRGPKLNGLNTALLSSA
jgi:hypothetical protein